MENLGRVWCSTWVVVMMVVVMVGCVCTCLCECTYLCFPVCVCGMTCVIWSVTFNPRAANGHHWGLNEHQVMRVGADKPDFQAKIFSPEPRSYMWMDWGSVAAIFRKFSVETLGVFLLVFPDRRAPLACSMQGPRREHTLPRTGHSHSHMLFVSHTAFQGPSRHLCR